MNRGGEREEEYVYSETVVEAVDAKIRNPPNTP